MFAIFDETSESAAIALRSGNAGANTAADSIQAAESALTQIPGRNEDRPEVLLRTDSAGEVHDLLDWAKARPVQFSVGFDLSESVRHAISQVPAKNWVSARNQDGKPCENGEVAEVTGLLDLDGWPEGCRVTVRRERPHPGVQLSFTDSDGHRFQATLTDQTDSEMLRVRPSSRNLFRF